MNSSAMSDPATKSVSVLSLMKYIPYPSIPHAGGSYALTHVAALNEFAEVTTLAPASPINVDAIKRVGAASESALLEEAKPRLKGVTFFLAQIESVLAGSAIYWPVRKLFRRKKGPWAHVTTSDIIEFQWSEMIALAPHVRRRFPKKILVGVAHDIITQRWLREASASPSATRRVLAKLAAHRSSRRESRSFSSLDCLIVFSEKDAKLAKALSPSVRIEVLHPSLGPKQPIRRSPDSSTPQLLFVGAMNRPENWTAALWFLEEVWEKVVQAVPNVRFIIAGANPPRVLERAISGLPNVELTGFVDSLEALYSRASVCVVPLKTGAGVKFKTVDALIRGVPVVTTSVGAEGIEGPEIFAGLADDAELFAEATIRALVTPNKSQIARGQAWAESEYGAKTFSQHLKEMYVNLVNSTTP